MHNLSVFYYNVIPMYILVQAGHSKVVTSWENEKKKVSHLEEEVERLREDLKSEIGTANDREVCGVLCTVTIICF